MSPEHWRRWADRLDAIAAAGSTVRRPMVDQAEDFAEADDHEREAALRAVAEQYRRQADRQERRAA
jgi:hypothetical protein